MFGCLGHNELLWNIWQTNSNYNSFIIMLFTVILNLTLKLNRKVIFFKNNS
jgi:hypothetical protein